MPPTIDRDLALHLEVLKKQSGDTVKIDDVGDVVRSLLTSLSGDVSAGDFKLYGEVQALASYIHNAKVEIAALKPQDIQQQYIASATDELDAIVGATENATNSILDAAEKLESLTAELSSEAGARLTEQTTLIYEACNFQDITGQRITKVVKALKHIEERIDALVVAFGPEIQDAEKAAQASSESSQMTDEDLLNGPQLPEKAHDQASIDALFDNI
jgi:chemotaxis protein CheZ